METIKKVIKKDPDARLDYTWDWTDWLVGADTIVNPVSVAYTPNDGSMTLGTPVINGGYVVVMISGGTLGRSYRVTASIDTAEGREDDRSFTLQVCQR